MMFIYFNSTFLKNKVSGKNKLFLLDYYSLLMKDYIEVGNSNKARE